MKKPLLTVLFCSLLATTTFAKTGPTYYTQERVSIGRENVEKYDWAKAESERIIKTGDKIEYYIGPKFTSAKQFAAQSDEFIWMLQPTTKIDRYYPRESNTRRLCPKHGDKGKRYSAFCPWKIDPINHPYKIQCMAGKEWYPSNDYASGDMTSGEFADDGNGFEYEGNRYYPLVEYAHMVYGSVVVPTLNSLSQAYLLTGENVYAHKCLILFMRLASEYPNYQDKLSQVYLKGKRAEGHKGGLITDHIWENFMLEDIAYAYDAVYDYIDTDASLVEFAKSKDLPIQNSSDIKMYIEEKILRIGMKEHLTENVKGNEGLHQASAMALALVMDDHSSTQPNSKDMVDYAYLGIGEAAYILTNGLTRDGGGHESPGYNVIKTDFVRVATLMQQVRNLHPDIYPADKYPDIFAEQKVKALFDYNIDMLVQDCWPMDIGDAGAMRKPSRLPDRARRYTMVQGTPNKNFARTYAFNKFKDPKYARACTDFDGSMGKGNLWQKYPYDKIKDALNNPKSKINRDQARLIDGYGLAIIASGQWPTAHEVTLNYTSLSGHKQNDPLFMQIFANGVNILPDLGYPVTWKYRFQYDANIMAHNTVTIDETQPWYGFEQTICWLFGQKDNVAVVTASSNAYNKPQVKFPDEATQIDLYERTAVMIDTGDDNNFYVVDLFGLKGGTQYDQSWHGMLVKPQLPKLTWDIQTKGTLAGIDVEKFGKWTDKWQRQRDDFPSFMTNIQRAIFDKPQVWNWTSKLDKKDAMNLHVIPVGKKTIEAINGTANTPARVEEVDYTLMRKSALPNEYVYYLSILDPYQNDSPTVKSAKLITEKPITIEITRTDNTIDTVTLNVSNSPSRQTQSRKMGVRVKTTKNGQILKQFTIGDVDDKNNGYAYGKIKDVDYDNNTITVSKKIFTKNQFKIGQYIRIFNDLRSDMFNIVNIEEKGLETVITLDKNALVGRFPVKKIEDSVIHLNVGTPFNHNSHSVDDDAITDNSTIEQARNNYAFGCVIGQGNTAKTIKALPSSGNGYGDSYIVLLEKFDDEKLKTDYANKNINVWHYGVGSKVEAALIK